MYGQAREVLAGGVASSFQMRHPWPVYLTHGEGPALPTPGGPARSSGPRLAETRRVAFLQCEKPGPTPQRIPTLAVEKVRGLRIRELP